MVTQTLFPFSRMSRRSLAGAAWPLILAISLALPTLPPVAQAETEGDDALDASAMTVNVELILDASGSMSETLPDQSGQTRMEAARDAMRNVIARIPAREGLNVGFRVYGHVGSSDDADRPRSCRSTELLVPIAGVDTEALLAQAASFEPAGWTPLALALETAAADFTGGGESVTNAIIMVTDGEETCGGEPCQAAGALRAAAIAVTTHVVGFALTEDQQQAVRCIADEGGGQLFAADDAPSLAEAVFAALAEVEKAPHTPGNASTEMEVGGYVGGNAGALLDEGAAGELAVVAVGRLPDGDIAVVIRNNTGEIVEAIGGQVIVRDAGTLAGVGNLQGVQPFVVEDGGYALAYGYFSGAELPPDPEFAFALTADPAGTDEITSTRDLAVAEANAGENGIVGILTNPHKETIAGAVIVAGVCFDNAGQPVAYVQSTTGAGQLQPDGMLPFALSSSLSGVDCSVFLVAGSGSAA